MSQGHRCDPRDMMVKYCSVVGVLPAGRWRCVNRAVAAVRAWQPHGVAGAKWRSCAAPWTASACTESLSCAQPDLYHKVKCQLETVPTALVPSGSP